MPKPKLTRVVLEFEDGSLQVLEGPDAETWRRIVDGYMMDAQLRAGGKDERLTALAWKASPPQDGDG
jgi:hypothetical protein